MNDVGFTVKKRGLPAQLPVLDRGVSALVGDLHERGMDKDVAVVVWGEFGRSPRLFADNPARTNRTLDARDPIVDHRRNLPAYAVEHGFPVGSHAGVRRAPPRPRHGARGHRSWRIVPIRRRPGGSRSRAAPEM